MFLCAYSFCVPHYRKIGTIVVRLPTLDTIDFKAFCLVLLIAQLPFTNKEQKNPSIAGSNIRSSILQVTPSSWSGSKVSWLWTNSFGGICLPVYLLCVRCLRRQLTMCKDMLLKFSITTPPTMNQSGGRSATTLIGNACASSHKIAKQRTVRNSSAHTQRISGSLSTVKHVFQHDNYKPTTNGHCQPQQ